MSMRKNRWRKASWRDKKKRRQKKWRRSHEPSQSVAKVAALFEEPASKSQH